MGNGFDVLMIRERHLFIGLMSTFLQVLIRLKFMQKMMVVETVVEETTETRPPASGVTNVNVNKDPVSGNVNVNTPDGTQVNINT